MVNNFLFCVCVCVLQVTWRANGIVLYMYEGNVLMDMGCFWDLIGNRAYWRELRPLVTPWVKSIKEGTDPWRNQKWALLSQCPGELPSSLSLSFPSLALLCFSILCCSYLLVKGLTGQANLLLNIASGKNSLSLSLRKKIFLFPSDGSVVL